MSKIPEDFKPILEKLIRSHKKLSSAEYKRNTAYNNQHFSAVAETEMIDWLLHNDRTFLNGCCDSKTERGKE